MKRCLVLSLALVAMSLGGGSKAYGSWGCYPVNYCAAPCYPTYCAPVCYPVYHCAPVCYPCYCPPVCYPCAPCISVCHVCIAVRVEPCCQTVDFAKPNVKAKVTITNCGPSELKFNEKDIKLFLYAAHACGPIKDGLSHKSDKDQTIAPGKSETIELKDVVLNTKAKGVKAGVTYTGEANLRGCYGFFFMELKEAKKGKN